MRCWLALACAAAVAVLVVVIGGLRAAPLSAHAPPPLPPPHLGYGISVRSQDSIAPLFVPLDFDWLKLWEEYEGDPPAERLPHNVLFAIECNGMPANLDQWGDHVEAIARAGLGFVEAYEVGNEPNTERFWGHAPPDPGQYVQMLQVAYERIKAVDPAAIVVSAGLAPVGRIQGTCNGWSGNNCSAMDEREYARQMLLLDGGECFDVFGYHPYGFAYVPETDPDSVSNGFAFRGAEVMHDLLGEYALGHKPIWATEFNWLRDWTEDGGMPTYCLDDYEAAFGWMEVTEVRQANYITRAFQYADENWPWMGAMFVWNLDWHDYHTWDCDPSRYFSVRKDDGTDYGAPALAYDALATMDKRPGYFGPKLIVEPPALTFQANVQEPGVLTATLFPRTIYRVLTWTATVATGLQVTPSLAVTTGLQGTPLTVTVDSTGYPTGTFTGSITVTTTMTDVLGAPRTVPVTLSVTRLVPRLAVVPPDLTFLADVHEPEVLTGVVVPVNTGQGVFTWTATVVEGMAMTGTAGTGTLGLQVTPTLAITTGLQGTPLTVTVDSTGYSTGTFIGIISVMATTTDVLDSPHMVPVMLRVVPEVRRVYLPLTSRSMP